MGDTIKYYTYIKFSDHFLEDQMAIGTGFGQLFRGVGTCYHKIRMRFIHSHSLFYFKGQVGGVAISSAIFQANLQYNLSQRIHGPDAAEVSTVLSSKKIADFTPFLSILFPPDHPQNPTKRSYNWHTAFRPAKNRPGLVQSESSPCFLLRRMFHTCSISCSVARESSP